MITAVDTNVLLDVLTDDPDHAAASRASLARAGREGAIVVCEIVYSELAAAFASCPDELDNFLADAGLHLVRTPVHALAEAGRMWRAYRNRGGPRSRVVADFLVAAHAAAVAERLLTRDRGVAALGPLDLAVVDPHAFGDRPDPAPG